MNNNYNNNNNNIKKVDNRFIPTYVPKDLPWYKCEGLLIWYDQNKCEEFLENTDEHFQNLQILNFDLINTNVKIDDDKLKQYQTINHHEIMGSPPQSIEQIMSSIFRANRPGMFVKKETALEHFNKPIKIVIRGRFIKKIKDDHYKETW